MSNKPSQQIQIKAEARKRYPKSKFDQDQFLEGAEYALSLSHPSPTHCTCDIDMNMFIPGCPVHDPENTGVPPKHLSQQQPQGDKVNTSNWTPLEDELEREAEQYVIKEGWHSEGKMFKHLKAAYLSAARKYRPEQGGEERFRKSAELWMESSINKTEEILQLQSRIAALEKQLAEDKWVSVNPESKSKEYYPEINKEVLLKVKTSDGKERKIIGWMNGWNTWYQHYCGSLKRIEATVTHYCEIP